MKAEEALRIAQSEEPLRTAIQQKRTKIVRERAERAECVQKINKRIKKAAENGATGLKLKYQFGVESGSERYIGSITDKKGGELLDRDFIITAFSYSEVLERYAKIKGFEVRKYVDDGLYVCDYTIYIFWGRDKVWRVSELDAEKRRKEAERINDAGYMCSTGFVSIPKESTSLPAYQRVKLFAGEIFKALMEIIAALIIIAIVVGLMVFMLGH